MRDEIITEVIKKLKEKNPHKFFKLDKDNIKQENYVKLIFEELLELQSNAIKNAERLLLFYGDSHNAESNNPSTTIHKLVIILDEIKKKKES